MKQNDAGLYPIEDRVLVKLIDSEEKTQGGIVIPKSTRDSEDMADIHGHLIAAGDEGMKIMASHGIDIGALVVFAKYAGVVYVGKDGGRYRIMNAGDVIAISEGVFDKMKARMPVST
jgi:chaperonin GroES